MSKGWADGWKANIKKENQLRLKWFSRNEQDLIAATIKQNSSRVTEEDLKELVETRRQLYGGAEKHPRIKTTDVDNCDVEANYSIMKAVPHEHTRLLYESANRGRKTYLKKREMVLPENRYHFPEKSSYNYGWKMWECSKTMEGSKYGRSAIVKTSFYRRRAGIERDPDWYVTPAKLSPTVCSCA